jgi:hypothetical protein
VGANLVVRGTDADVLDQVVTDLRALVRGLGVEPIEA